MHQHRFAADLDRLRGLQHGGAKIGDLIDQMHAQRLLTGPYPAICDGTYVVDVGMPALSHGAHELSVHVVDEPLHILPFRGRKLAGGITSVLELAHFQHFGFQFGPAHEVAVVDPLGNYPYRSDYAAIVGIDFVGCCRNVVSAAGPNRRDGRNDVLLLFVTDSFDFAVNLL